MFKRKIVYPTLFLFALVLGAFVASEEPLSDRFEIGKNLDIFAALYKEVNSTYVDGTQPGKLMKTGVDAMLETLDPYTVYYPESEIEDYKLLTTGQYGGIGAKIRRIDDFVVIDEPYEGFPAFKAGLRAGDIILKVDGKDVKGKSTADLSKILKGNPGTSLNVLIERPGQNKPFEVVFKREEIQLKSVPYFGMVDDSIGYIQMTSFTRKVSNEVENAIQELKKNKELKGIILDLRGNPGGLLHEAINTVNLFVAKGEKVVETRGKIDAWTKTYKTLNPSLDRKIQVTVLVNGRSASASEIVSGALQDLDRGVVIGRRTYGKGLVQTTKQLKYNTSVKITTAKYYIPSGRCIQAIDYSKRDDNGKVEKIADSLLTNFKTKNGRLVKDGAGILPDIEMEDTILSPIIPALINNNLIFKFATQYVLDHPNGIDSKTFQLTETDFQNFVEFIKDEDLSYETQTDIELKQLKEKATKEHYIEDIQKQIDLIEQNLAEKKKLEISKNKDQIIKYLELEIVTRYFHQKGKIEHQIKNDPYVLKAIEVLKNNKQYRQILSEQSK